MMARNCGDCKDVNQEKDFEFSQVWDTFNALRLQKQLCDVVLCVGSRRFEAHRAILAANSAYFRAMFTNGMKESETKEVQLKNVDPEIIALIIDYIYTRTVKVNMDNIMPLLSLADCYSVNGLTDACVEYMVSALGFENCFTILRFAKMYYRMDLTNAAKVFITTNFKEIVSSNNREFLECNIDELLDVLGDDNLNVLSEKEVFEAGIQWVQHDESSRCCHVPRILQQVRLCNIDPTEVLEAISMNRLCSTPASQTVITLSYEFLLNAKKVLRGKKNLSHPLLRPRIPNGILFAIGGWSGGSPISKIETYDCKSDQWFSFPDCQDSNPRAYHGLVVYNQKIYIIGGFNGTEYYNSVRYFDPEIKEWQDAAPMYTPRCYVSTTNMRDHIYACGGYDGRWRLNTVERFHPPTNQWTKIASMLVKRSDAGADALNGKIYIAGGFNGEHCLNTAEVFDPKTNQWTMLPPMTMSRSGVSVCTYKDSLYVIGGFDGESRLRTCERYNRCRNTWEPIPEMFSQRSNCAVTVLNSMLVVMGGFNGSLTISGVECFDEETNAWYDMTDMSVNRSALRAVVLHGLPNARDFTYHGHHSNDVIEVDDSESDNDLTDMVLD